MTRAGYFPALPYSSRRRYAVIRDHHHDHHQLVGTNNLIAVPMLISIFRLLFLGANDEAEKAARNSKIKNDSLTLLSVVLKRASA